jgi:hypothetical protein
MKGEAGSEQQQTEEHEAAVRDAAQGDSDYADSLHRYCLTDVGTVCWAKCIDYQCTC